MLMPRQSAKQHSGQTCGLSPSNNPSSKPFWIDIVQDRDLDGGVVDGYGGESVSLGGHRGDRANKGLIPE